MASDAASHFGVPAHDPLALDRQERSRSVAADLEAIFGRAAPVAGGRGLPAGRTPRAPGRKAPGERGVSAATAGALAAAALAGVAAGALLGKPTFHSARSGAPPLVQPSVAATAPPLPTSPPSPAGDAMAVAPAVGRAPVPTARPAPRTAPARNVRRTARPLACCTFADARAADRRLRAAYDEAIRAGVPRADIVEARDRWASVRRRARHDPERLVADYRRIAADLERASDRADDRARAPEARTVQARFRPRYPAWWR